MPRKTRRRMVGKKMEDAAQAEREQQLEDLEREIHREQRARKAKHAKTDDSQPEEDA